MNLSYQRIRDSFPALLAECQRGLFKLMDQQSFLLLWQFSQNPSVFVKQYGWSRLGNRTGVASKDRTNIFNGSCLNMSFDNVVSVRIVFLRHIIKQNQIQVCLVNIQFSEILWEANFKTNPDSHTKGIYFYYARIPAFGEVFRIPSP